MNKCTAKSKIALRIATNAIMPIYVVALCVHIEREKVGSGGGGGFPICCCRFYMAMPQCPNHVFRLLKLNFYATQFLLRITFQQLIFLWCILHEAQYNYELLLSYVLMNVEELRTSSEREFELIAENSSGCHFMARWFMSLLSTSMYGRVSYKLLLSHDMLPDVDKLLIERE